MDLMTEFWKWAITIGVSVNGLFLGLLLKVIFSMKADVKAMIVEIKTETSSKIQKVCDDDRDSHKQIWERIHHHGHTESGDVIIRE